MMIGTCKTVCHFYPHYQKFKTEIKQILAPFQDIMQELPVFEQKIARLRAEAKIVAEVCTPEAAADMTEAVDKLEARYAAIQQSAQQREQTLSEAGELWDQLEEGVEQVAAWNDTASELAAAKTNIGSIDVARAKVDEHKVRMKFFVCDFARITLKKKYSDHCTLIASHSTHISLSKMFTFHRL